MNCLYGRLKIDATWDRSKGEIRHELVFLNFGMRTRSYGFRRAPWLLIFLLCLPYCVYLFVDTVVRRGYEKRV